MFKKFTKKRVLATLSMVTLATLLVQAYVLAQPTSAPPGGNINATFSSASFTDDVTIATPEGNDAQFFVGNDAGTWGRMLLDSGSDDLFLETAINSIPNSNQLVLSSGNGYIGMGNATPGNNLVVGDSIGALAIGTSVVASETSGNSSFAVGEASGLYGVMQWDYTNDNMRLFAIDNTETGNTSSHLVLEGGTGNVGIGTANPETKLQIGNTTSPYNAFNSSHPTSLSIISDSLDPGILLGDDSGTNSAEIIYSQAQDLLQMGYQGAGYFNNTLNITPYKINGGVGVLTDTIFTALTVGDPGSSDTTFKAAHPNGIAIADNLSTRDPALWIGKDSGIHSEIIFDNDQNQLNIGVMTLAGISNGISITASSHNPRVSIGDNVAPDNTIPLTVAEEDAGYVAQFLNNSNNTLGKGLLVQAGTSLTGTLIDFANYTGTVIGNITFSSGTVSYNAFTGGHYAEIPSSSNASGYEYGTIISLTSLETEDGSHQPQYSAAPSSSPYDNHIMGVYADKNADSENSHQIFALGDGHVLVTTENGSIKAGDPITSSNAAGLGMKATEAGTILGYALEDWDGSQTTRTETLADGTEVKVGLVAVYYYPGTQYTPDQATQIQNLQDQINTQNEVIADLREAIDSLK